MNNYKRNFRIATLSDCGDCNNTLNDPITIIAGGVAFLQSLFPGLSFGGRNAAQVQADEIASMNFHKAAFLRDYGIQLSDQVVIAVLRPGWDQGENGSQLWQRIMVRFYNENKAALLAVKGGMYPYASGQVAGGIYSGALDYAALAPIAIGGIILLLLMKKKKK
jgi:hypothetical protein